MPIKRIALICRQAEFHTFLLQQCRGPVWRMDRFKSSARGGLDMLQDNGNIVLNQQFRQSPRVPSAGDGDLQIILIRPQYRCFDLADIISPDNDLLLFYKIGGQGCQPQICFLFLFCLAFLLSGAEVIGSAVFLSFWLFC